MMPVPQIDPRPVSNASEVVGRSHDIGEKHRRKHPVDVAGRPISGQKFLHLIQHRILVPDPGNVGIALQFDEMGSGNTIGNVATFVDLDVLVVGSVDSTRIAALLAFYEFPAELWIHIRSSNVIESSFATVRHRTDRTKGCLTRDRMLAMIYKLGLCAERSWRRLRGFEWLAKIVDGVKFPNGVEVQNVVRSH
jgi:hypothetical protein